MKRIRKTKAILIASNPVIQALHTFFSRRSDSFNVQLLSHNSIRIGITKCTFRYINMYTKVHLFMNLLFQCEFGNGREKKSNRIGTGRTNKLHSTECLKMDFRDQWFWCMCQMEMVFDWITFWYTHIQHSNWWFRFYLTKRKSTMIHGRNCGCTVRFLLAGETPKKIASKMLNISEMRFSASSTESLSKIMELESVYMSNPRIVLRDEW